MKIAILGTRGIPNYHGGFEQFTEYFSVFLVKEGHEVYVYNSSVHPFTETIFKGVNIISCYDPEDKIGTSGQFIYDLNCILDSRSRKFDIILQLGYTSSSIWANLFPKKSIIITNMDGLEWKRSKYSKNVQKFLKFAEKRAVKTSDYLISDSIGIQDYLEEKYNAESEYIAYGAELFNSPDDNILEEYSVKPYNYDMLIARLEPENNIETILNGVVLAGNSREFLVIGKHDTNKFGEYLKEKFKKSTNIKFIGGVYNINHLNNLRFYSNLYFHGHSVGGTNPSLLEAMSSKALIIANNNKFNKAILNDNAFYFNNEDDVKNAITNLNKNDFKEKLDEAYMLIATNFSWEVINNSYLRFFNKCFNKKHPQRH